MDSPSEKLLNSLEWWETHDGFAERRIHIQRARSRIAELERTLGGIRDMIDACAEYPRKPNSILMLILAEVSAALKAPTP